MTKYVKKIDKYTVETAPKNFGDIVNYNAPANEPRLLADGWRRLVETDSPGSDYRAAYAIRGDEIRQTWETRPLEELKKERIARMNAAADAVKAAAESGFSGIELATKALQGQGAADLSLDPDSITPEAETVRTIAEYRGMDVEEAAAIIRGHTVAADALAAKVVGILNNRIDRIKAAASLDELNAITWPDDLDAEEPPTTTQP